MNKKFIIQKYFLKTNKYSIPNMKYRQAVVLVNCEKMWDYFKLVNIQHCM